MDLPLISATMKPVSYIDLPLRRHDSFNLYKVVYRLLESFSLLRELTGVANRVETRISRGLSRYWQGQFHVTVRAVTVTIWAKPGNCRRQSMEIPVRGVKTCNCQTPAPRGKNV